jgi:23S rRNA (guanine745-N1)-methyltransferase
MRLRPLARASTLRIMTGCPDLLCPVCHTALAHSGLTFRCAQGHSFDRSRHGFLDLLPHGHGRSNRIGDTREMIAARQRFLGAAHYQTLARTVAGIVGDAVSRKQRPVILDAGCGDGFYLERTLDALTGDACGYGFDISSAALRAAARRCPRCTFFLNDVTHRVCLPDGAVDCVLDIFAPRNSSEFARVLSSDGALVVVVPGPHHMQQLAQLLPIAVPEDKLDSTVAALPDFRLEAHAKVEFIMSLDVDAVVDLALMGPSGHHRTADQMRQAVAADGVAARDVTASFDVLTLAHH